MPLSDAPIRRIARLAIDVAAVALVMLLALPASAVLLVTPRARRLESDLCTGPR